MKIAFTGAHGVGKSTLVNHDYWKSTSFKSYKVIDSFSRGYPKGWTDKKRQFYVNKDYIISHVFNKNFISSRTIFDPWAYSRINIGLNFNFWLFHLASKYINYDYVFYVPIEFSLVDDNFRPMDKDFQVAIDNEIIALLKFYHVPCHTLSGTVGQRMDKVVKTLNL